MIPLYFWIQVFLQRSWSTVLLHTESEVASLSCFTPVSRSSPVHPGIWQEPLTTYDPVNRLTDDGPFRNQSPKLGPGLLDHGPDAGLNLRLEQSAEGTCMSETAAKDKRNPGTNMQES